MSRGKRYDANETKKLNLKKVFGVLITFFVVILTIIIVAEILRK